MSRACNRESFKAKQPQNAPFPPKGPSSRLFRPFAMEHTGALGPLAHKTINELANKWSTPGNLQPPERKLLIARRTRFLTAWLSCSLQRSLAHTILACGAVADHSQSDMPIQISSLFLRPLPLTCAPPAQTRALQSASNITTTQQAPRCTH